MQQIQPCLFKAYASQYEELILKELHIHGEVPTWLSGSFISIGPSQFEVGSTNFNHWFDGFAMLKKFTFKSGCIHFQNQFLQSQEYIESNRRGKLNANEFGTYASKSKLGRVLFSLKELVGSKLHDNCVVNTTRIDDSYIAMTESKNVVSFNIKNLSTTKNFNFNDKITEHLTTAHPHFDPTTGELINIAIEVGKANKYHIYKIDPLSKTRKIIQTYLSHNLFYIHSFSITRNYIILFKSPLVINKFKLLFGLPFNNTLAYKENLPSVFVIVDRRNGKLHEIEAEPFVCIHSINAYEHKNEIILDLICQQAGNPYDKLYLSNLCSSKPTLPTGAIKRYVVDTQARNCNQEILTSNNQEFPRINYKRCNGNNYQFIYTNSIDGPNNQFFNTIQKMNTQTGSIQHWRKKDNYVGEALFVSKPHCQSEDDGILLSIAFDINTQLSTLIIIDALSMQLLAEAYLPIHLPFGLHGNFYNDTIV
ncbi:8'-apo-beta-carotenal 15,15'-oxygenase [Legionella busanensis]|uniref:8'-apo-beta-carotenal 15,15'-oxygenase n=1 Tax=Legionella busanensis TaxID=190655 RepID=A0A378JSJ5_9GAMM|nr:carotenoid oxygenase family protein [Legionella busanensis]STX51142.1 8'-apo-beta-carotenal 15,15'-oxygenase [Legionella busanensis]